MNITEIGLSNKTPYKYLYIVVDQAPVIEWFIPMAMVAFNKIIRSTIVLVLYGIGLRKSLFCYSHITPRS